MKARHNKARKLFLIGGAAASCLSHFVRLAGGKNAHIVVLPHASGIPRQVGDELAAKFAKLGVKQVTVITPRSLQVLPEDVDAIYFTGGSQSRLFGYMQRSPEFFKQIQRAYRRGVLIAGTSAGAAVAGDTMITGGMTDGKLAPESAQFSAGLAFIAGVVVDTHFMQRKRVNRMRAAIATVSRVCALGLDEDTGVYIEDGTRCKVYGEHEVRLFRRGFSGSRRAWMTEANAATITVYRHGSRFEL